MVLATWYLTISDDQGRPTLFPFDLVECSSLLIIGLDIKRHSDTLNRRIPPALIFKRLMDREARMFFTYISDDEKDNLRLRAEIVTYGLYTKAGMLAIITMRKTLNMGKKVHRFTHLSSTEMKSILTDAGYDDTKLGEACDRLYTECDICASSGRPGK